VRYVEDGPLADVVADALFITGWGREDADDFTITVKREGHDASGAR
jgi:hypothetical protein